MACPWKMKWTLMPKVNTNELIEYLAGVYQVAKIWDGVLISVR